MQSPTHQTVRLSKGRHSSPEHGACVMELASMLAGESFTDHPRSVSGAIATFLRSYNDIVDDDRRQDLYHYASAVVGTAGDETVEQARAARMIQWADSIEGSRWSPFLRITRRRVHATRHRSAEEAARYAIRVIPRISDRSHARVLGLLDDLIAIGTAGATPAADAPAPGASPTAGDASAAGAAHPAPAHPTTRG
jgi:hypothetical protein